MSGNTIGQEIEDWLVGKEIYPFSVLYVDSPEFLKISFYLETDIQEFLGLIEYTKMCDTSGVLIISETNTILLQGIGLINLLRHVKGS